MNLLLAMAKASLLILVFSAIVVLMIGTIVLWGPAGLLGLIGVICFILLTITYYED